TRSAAHPAKPPPPAVSATRRVSSTSPAARARTAHGNASPDPETAPHEDSSLGIDPEDAAGARLVALVLDDVELTVGVLPERRDARQHLRAQIAADLGLVQELTVVPLQRVRLAVHVVRV